VTDDDAYTDAVLRSVGIEPASPASSIFAQPLGLSRDPYWDDAWTDKYSNQYVLPHPDNPLVELRAGRASELGKTISNTFTLKKSFTPQA